MKVNRFNCIMDLVTLSKGVCAVEWWIWQSDFYIILKVVADHLHVDFPVYLQEKQVYFVLFWVVYEMSVAEELNFMQYSLRWVWVNHKSKRKDVLLRSNLFFLSYSLYEGL